MQGLFKIAAYYIPYSGGQQLNDFRKFYILEKNQGYVNNQSSA